jgi:hypothetical protein
VIKNVEVVDLVAGAGTNQLTLTASDVLAMSTTTNTLTVEGDTADSVLSGGWSLVGTAAGYTTWTQLGATLIIDQDITQLIGS